MQGQVTEAGGLGGSPSARLTSELGLGLSDASRWSRKPAERVLEPQQVRTGARSAWLRPRLACHTRPTPMAPRGFLLRAVSITLSLGTGAQGQPPEVAGRGPHARRTSGFSWGAPSLCRVSPVNRKDPRPGPQPQQITAVSRGPWMNLRAPNIFTLSVYHFLRPNKMPSPGYRSIYF